MDILLISEIVFTWNCSLSGYTFNNSVWKLCNFTVKMFFFERIQWSKLQVTWTLTACWEDGNNYVHKPAFCQYKKFWYHHGAHTSPLGHTNSPEEGDAIPLKCNGLICIFFLSFNKQLYSPIKSCVILDTGCFSISIQLTFLPLNSRHTKCKPKGSNLYSISYYI